MATMFMAKILSFVCFSYLVIFVLQRIQATNISTIISLASSVYFYLLASLASHEQYGYSIFMFIFIFEPDAPPPISINLSKSILEMQFIHTWVCFHFRILSVHKFNFFLYYDEEKVYNSRIQLLKKNPY